MAAENNNQNEQVKFELAGDMYEMPDVLDLDMDEWVVVYDYSGLVLDDFAPLVTRDADGNITDGDEEAENERLRRLRHPGFMKAMVHIGYQRAHPKKTASTVKGLISKAKMLPLLQSMADDEETQGDDPTLTMADDEETQGDDPTLTTEPAPSSRPSSVGSSESSSLASPLSLETPDDDLATTGIFG